MANFASICTSGKEEAELVAGAGFTSKSGKEEVEPVADVSAAHDVGTNCRGTRKSHRSADAAKGVLEKLGRPEL